ncbi:MAG: PIN domain nuclease [Chloroflexi bacterium]|nr:PIN domain nuclease [Chloroflexota bacterium]
MVIVDTTVWIDYLNGIESLLTEWLDVEIGRQRLGLTDLILCEILQGVRDEHHAETTRRELANFEMIEMGGINLAIASAKNYRALRAQGITVRKTIDCLIATFCIANNHVLLHNDRDFDAFENHLGLRVVHP